MSIHSAEWVMQLRSHRAAALRPSCSQYVVGSLVSAGDYQVQQYQPPLCRGPVLCATLQNVCRMKAVLLMHPRTQAATSDSKMSMACARTSGEVIPTPSGSPRCSSSPRSCLDVQTSIHPNSAFGSMPAQCGNGRATNLLQTPRVRRRAGNQPLTVPRTAGANGFIRRARAPAL